MNTFWKIVVYVSLILAAGGILLDFFSASKGEEGLEGYQVVEMETDFELSVFKHLARTSDLFDYGE